MSSQWIYNKHSEEQNTEAEHFVTIQITETETKKFNLNFRANEAAGLEDWHLTGMMIHDRREGL